MERRDVDGGRRLFGDFSRGGYGGDHK
ncbi:hypothetical protein CCACVL1_30257 [Corchorus capsularis]|uniref:Uncharacterized protein n=1 Tax=Corchorus capsularis TaxID=210143 RepID=A0A1R3FY77_COCAP|nr:hypothetical protein CCACVL1_30257 [Corchorus capsularis]